MQSAKQSAKQSAQQSGEVSSQVSTRRVAPALTLLALSPIVVEFLYGSTHVSMAYLLLPQLGVYGCGALIIRALARYQRRGWIAILLMGLAFAVAEECLTLQTALAPLFIAAK